jgi:tetratricopeptide (TPR) repeat protein
MTPAEANAAMAMKDQMLSWGRMAALLLPMTTGPLAYAADKPAAAASGATSASESSERKPKPGQLSTLFPIDDSDPESTVPTPKDRDGNPLEFGYYLQDLVAKAEAATRKNDHAAAIRTYRALAASIPNQAQGWSRLCEAYEAARDRKRALGACNYAIDRQGAELKDFTRFVNLMVSTEASLTAEESTALNEVLTHLDKQPDLAVPAAHLRCKAAVKMNDRAGLEACTGLLAKLAPDDSKTVVFQWSLAVMRGEREQAALLVGRARELGVEMESIDRMTKVTTSWRWSSRMIGAVALGGVGVVVALFVIRRRRLAAARAS